MTGNPAAVFRDKGKHRFSGGAQCPDETGFQRLTERRFDESADGVGILLSFFAKNH
jgi:hypothetical protein